MMTCGLLDAYATFHDKKFLDAAAGNLRFIEKNLCADTTLFRSYKNKRSTTPGFLDDYAYYILALTKYYQVTFHEPALLRAVEFTQTTIREFFDTNERYFFYTSLRAERMIARKKEIFDNVIPSSNAIMAQNLLWLGTMMDIRDWQEMSKSLVAPLQSLIHTEPSYMSQWAIALMEHHVGLKEVVLSGKSDAHRQELQQVFMPFAAYLRAAADSAIPLVADKLPAGDRDTIYVCHRRVCQLPVHDTVRAIAQIKT
jgi:uncharacterized protein YyaL (SSP411 family)